MRFPFETVALVGKYNAHEISGPIVRLAQFMEQKGCKVLITVQTADRMGIPGFDTARLADIGRVADLAIVIGGDGTMLNVARVLADYDIAVVGVNQGRLGFLTDVSVDTMFETLEEILAGKFTSENRFLLDVVIEREGEGEALFHGRAFNDVVVSKGATGRLIETEVFIDGQFVYSQRSDGIIIASPTGSTAYALSAGGPILHPTLEAMVLVPICPHTLSNRPIAVHSHAEVEVLVIHADDCNANFDGQRRLELKPGDRVRVRRSDNSLLLLRPPGHSYYDMLRQKLHWGEKL
jgi:NAD+ kinase